MDRQLEFRVQKVNEDLELGIVWGFVSVADIVDRQGDVMPEDELVRVHYDFMERYYLTAAGQAAIGQAAELKQNHEGSLGVRAVIVESTLVKWATRTAWFVGVKLRDPELREAQKRGEISGFSIGGTAVMVEE